MNWYNLMAFSSPSDLFVKFTMGSQTGKKQREEQIIEPDR